MGNNNDKAAKAAKEGKKKGANGSAPKANENQGSKPAAAAKPVEKPVDKKVEKKVEDAPLIPEVVDDHTPVARIIKSVSDDPSVKHMSPDSKVALGTLLNSRFGPNNPIAATRYSQAFIDEVDLLTDVVAISALYDFVGELKGQGFAAKLLIGKKDPTAMTEICKLLGINLKTNQKQLASNGQGELDFEGATADNTVAEAIDNERQARKALADSIPELDPKAITSEDMFKSALNYMMRSTSNVLKSLFATIVWIRGYYEVTKTTKEDKAKYAAFTTADWTTEILQFIKPTLLLTGLGRSVYLTAAQDGTPIVSHCIIRKAAAGKDNEVILTEEEISDLVTVLLKENARWKLKNEPETMKGKALSDDKALMNCMKGSEELIDGILSKETDTQKKIYYIVKNNYYGSETMVPETQMRNKLGQLINMYMPVADKLAGYESIELDAAAPIASTQDKEVKDETGDKSPEKKN